MNTPEETNSEHTESNKDVHEEAKSIVSLIKRYEDFMGQAIVSAVPLWVLRYYDGMPETYIDNIDDDRHQD